MGLDKYRTNTIWNHSESFFNESEQKKKKPGNSLIINQDINPENLHIFPTESCNAAVCTGSQ